VSLERFGLQGPAVKESRTDDGEGDVTDARGGDGGGKHDHVRHVKVIGNPGIRGVTTYDEDTSSAERMEALNPKVNESGLVALLLVEGDAV